MTGTRVRDAVPGDAAAIGSIHVRCWQHAYVDIVPAALLASLDVDRRVEQWEQRLSATTPARTATLVSIDDAEAVTGFAQVGPAAGDDPDPALGILYAIYLEPSTIGTGVGRELLAAAHDRMRDLGFTRAGLDVLPANDRARRVYEAAGWRAKGGQWIVLHGEHELPHQRYVIEL